MKTREFLMVPKIVAVVIALAVAGCGSSPLSDLSSANLLPRVDQLARPDWLTYSGGNEQFSLRPVTAADLVSADGQCAAEGATSDAGPDGSGAGIALQMTECDVVRRAGTPQQIQIGADERGDRSVVATYVRGPRPGIYRFAAGRLTSIERAPEAPGAKAPSAKAAPKAKAPKKAERS
jgi:hypothetical protein